MEMTFSQGITRGGFPKGLVTTTCLTSGIFPVSMITESERVPAFFPRSITRAPIICERKNTRSGGDFGTAAALLAAMHHLLKEGQEPVPRRMTRKIRSSRRMRSESLTHRDMVILGVAYSG